MGIMGNGFTWLYYTNWLNPESKISKHGLLDIVGCRWTERSESVLLCVLYAAPRYKARQVLATGSLLLDGPGPGAEGVAGHGRLGLGPIRRAQLFETCEDTSRRAMASAFTADKIDKPLPYMVRHGPIWIHMVPLCPFWFKFGKYRIGTQACNQTGVSGYPILKTCNVCDFIGTCTRWSAKLHHHLPSNHSTPSNISCNMMKMRHATRIELGQLYLYIWWSI